MSQRKSTNSTMIYVIGALVGTGMGLLSAHMYRRGLEERALKSNDIPKPGFMDLVKIGIMAIGFVRQISQAGANTGQNQS